MKKRRRRERCRPCLRRLTLIREVLSLKFNLKIMNKAYKGPQKGRMGNVREGYTMT